MYEIGGKQIPLTSTAARGTRAYGVVALDVENAIDPNAF